MASSAAKFSRALCLSVAGFLSACSSDETNVAPTTSSTGNEAIASIQNPAASLEAESPELGSFGIDLSHQDPNTQAGDDFFRYANGKWLDTFELPASRSNYGSFTVLGDRSDQRVRDIIDDLTNIEPADESIEQKISDYYLSYMHNEALNDLGISPLLPGLSTLDAIDTIEELIQGFGRALIDNTATPFGFYVGADRSDPDKHQ